MAKDLLDAILVKKPAIGRQGLKVTLSRIKKRHDLKSIEQAACFYIKQQKVDVNVSSIIDEITRQAVQDNSRQGKQNETISKLPHVINKRKAITNSTVGDPFITDQIVNAANRNAEIYPLIYLFENSVRNFVNAVMTKNFGDDWWETKVATVNTKIAGDVAIRKLAEKQAPWHSRRGAHSIYYTDINDLQKIINTYSKEFRKVLSNFDLVKAWIEEIEKTRNILAHNNPVTTKDQKRLELYADDWNKCTSLVYEKLKK